MPDVATERCPTPETGDAIALARKRVIDSRTALPAHDLDVEDLRRWAIAACSAELKHAERETLGLAARHGLAPFIDSRTDPGWHAEFRLPHEHAAARVLAWESHLQTQEGFIVGPWACWPLSDRAGRRALLAARRRLKRGFLAAVSAYRAARAELATREAA